MDVIDPWQSFPGAVHTDASPGGSPRSAEHREHWRRVSDDDLSHDLKTVALVEGHAERSRRFEISEHSVLVADGERILEQSGAETAPLIGRVNTDHSEIPVRFLRMMLGHRLAQGI